MNLKLTTYVFTAKKNQQKTNCTTEYSPGMLKMHGSPKNAYTKKILIQNY